MGVNLIAAQHQMIRSKVSIKTSFMLVHCKSLIAWYFATFSIAWTAFDFFHSVKMSLLYLQSTQITFAIYVIKSLLDHGDCVFIYNNILIRFVVFLCSCGL